jgi:rhamnosyltransferase
VSEFKSVAAVVTTFNPDISLVANLQRIAGQVGLVILVDDSGVVEDSCEVDYSAFDHLIYIKNDANKGIAASLNTGVLRAAKEGYNWVITLDDDTLVSETYVSDVLEFIQTSQLPNVGLVACARGDVKQANSRIGLGFFIKRTLITSGSVCSVETFRKVGGFDESMFIDLVDFDFCTKVRKIGCSIVLLNKLGLEHKVGNSFEVNLAFMHFVVYNHAPFRLYYQIRNAFTFLRKHFAFDPVLAVYLFLDVFRLPLKALLFERTKLKRLKYLCLGLIDGLLGRGGRMRIDLN